MFNRLRQLLTPPEAKASRTARLVAFENGGRARWTPRDYTALAREGYLANAIVHRSVRLIAENAAACQFLVFEGAAERDGHPLAQLLTRPNPRQDGANLFETLYAHLLLAGNGYLEQVSLDEKVRELYALRPDRMKVVPGSDGWAEAYEYTVGSRSLRFDQQATSVPPILHLTFFHPLDDHYGLAPLEAAAIAVDAAIQIAVLDLTRSAPPASPADGERHVVASGATGAWAGHVHAIATWQDGAWAFLAPNKGWCVWSVADDVLFVFDGSSWRDLRDLPVSLDNAAHVGINTTASAPNLLSVRSNAALLTAIPAASGGSGDARLQISKESASKTASVFFSDAFSGRAEFGLVGSDAFKLKVSADGSAWVEAFTIDQSSGNLALPRGLALSGVIAPPQLTANQNDYNPSGIASASTVQLSSDASRTVSGLAGGAEGRVVSLGNIGSQPIVLSDESTSSAAANRFSLGGALTISPKQAALLRYDGTAQRWRTMSGGAGFLAASSNLSDLGSLPAARANLGVRELLTANRTYYVRTDGNNANSGLANNSAGAFLTLQRAFDVITQTLDLGGCTVTVQIADGTYSAGVAVSQPWTGGGAVTFQGNSATPANVLVSASTDCFSAVGVLPGVLSIRDIKLSTSAGAGILHSAAGVVQFSNINFGACTTGHIMSIASGANVVCTGNYTISGNVAYHAIAAKFGVISVQSKTVTLSGTPAFSGAFALVNPNGLVMIDGCTFSGSATGARYSAANGGTIFTAGAATTYLPGSTAGTGTNYGTTPFGLYA